MIDIQELKRLANLACGGPMVQWPSNWKPWWKDPRLSALETRAFQEATDPHTILELLARLEQLEEIDLIEEDGDIIFLRT